MGEPFTIACSTHGARPSAVVCRHHLEHPSPQGFVENSTEPHDLQAWCSRCEARYLEEGGLTEAFRAFNAFAVVCVDCYADLRRRHTIHPAA